VFKDKTFVLGFAERHLAQVSITTGLCFKTMSLSVSGPRTGLPVNWFQSECVVRSNISLLERYNSPEDPKTKGLSCPGIVVSTGLLMLFPSLLRPVLAYLEKGGTKKKQAYLQALADQHKGV
jgi:hypothetical protein